MTISIHALREEGDSTIWRLHPQGHLFLSTPSARRATLVANRGFIDADISIHALREEGDSRSSFRSRPAAYFYPRPPRGGRPKRSLLIAKKRQFLSTPSARRATGIAGRLKRDRCDFYPRPPRGGRPQTKLDIAKQAQFLSTPSARRATGIRVSLAEGHQDFYPRPPRGGRPIRDVLELCVVGISIHALREEGDHCERIQGDAGDHISIHALREEGDVRRPPAGHEQPQFLSTPSARRATFRLVMMTVPLVFLSTPSARRATELVGLWYGDIKDFYPRPPRGGRLLFLCILDALDLFLSTPSARRATYKDTYRFRDFEFLSTPSARRATGSVANYSKTKAISIHALREEGDSTSVGCVTFWFLFLSTPSARRATMYTDAFPLKGNHFYPRPPRGGRRCALGCNCLLLIFLSTPSARRATFSPINSFQ